MPASAKMLGLTAKIYAMVIKVVIPAMTSVLTVVWFCDSLKIRSNIQAHDLTVLYLSYPVSWFVTFVIHFLCYMFVARKRLDRIKPVLQA